MIKAFEIVFTMLNNLRCEDAFREIIGLQDVNRQIVVYDLYELTIPQIRIPMPPSRYSGPAEAHMPQLVEEH